MGSRGRAIVLIISAFLALGDTVPILGGNVNKGKLGNGISWNHHHHLNTHYHVSHPKFKCIRISCRWVGTSPFCEGTCSNDEIKVNSSKEGDGAPCWTGTKVKCCKKLKW